MIRLATPADAAAIVAIYNHYIATTTISFEEQPVTADEMAGRIEGVLSKGLPWLVAAQDGEVVGYAYATPWRVRSAYRFSVETSVYVSSLHPRKGIGKQLYGKLIGELRERGLHMAIGGIAQPNQASVALHESVGFRKVAHFSQVGMKFGRWIDVGYWELPLTA